MADKTKAAKEDIDLDKAQLDIIRKQTALLERYEGKIHSLLQDRLDECITEDAWSELQEDLRKAFLREFQDLYTQVDNSTPELHFRKVLYTATLAQVKRYFAYYNALVDVNAKVNQYNMELNDQVIEIDTQDQIAMIRKLEHVKLTMVMAEALDIPKDFFNRIVNHAIDKAFGAHHK
jgi:predicted ATPase with chaperone activity